MEFAREHGCDEVRSNVDPEAVRFYERLGFDVVGSEDAGSVPMSKGL